MPTHKYGIQLAALGFVFAMNLFLSTIISASMSPNAASSHCINHMSNGVMATDLSCPDCVSTAMAQMQNNLDCDGCLLEEKVSCQCSKGCAFAASIAVLSTHDFRFFSALAPSYDGLGIAISKRTLAVDPAPPKIS